MSVGGRLRSYESTFQPGIVCRSWPYRHVHWSTKSAYRLAALRAQSRHECTVSFPSFTTVTHTSPDTYLNSRLGLYLVVKICCFEASWILSGRKCGHRCRTVQHLVGRNKLDRTSLHAAHAQASVVTVAVVCQLYSVPYSPLTQQLEVSMHRTRRIHQVSWTSTFSWLV